MATDPEILTGMSSAGLEALADGFLATSQQARLSELLSKNSETKLSNDEVGELDRLLEIADEFTLLKTRARYTLSYLKAETAGT